MEIRFIVFAVMVAVTGVTAYIYASVVEWQSQTGELIVLTSPFLPRLWIFLIISFLIAGTGLLLKRKGGVVISLLGLLGVLLGHLVWFFYTTSTIKFLEKEPQYIRHPELLPQHTWGLGGAEWWNIAILLGSIVLLVWEVSILAQKRKENPSEPAA